MGGTGGTDRRPIVLVVDRRTIRDEPRSAWRGDGLRDIPALSGDLRVHQNDRKGADEERRSEGVGDMELPVVDARSDADNQRQQMPEESAVQNTGQAIPAEEGT